MPGDLHKLWRTRDRKGYHVEYGYSCMGYEVAGGIGVRMASPDRDVFVMVGDGSYLMMATELVTAVQEGVKVIVVLVQNHGFASIGSLSESLGSQRFGTSYRYRDDSGRLAGDKLPVDLAANAASLGAEVIKVTTAAEFTDAVKVAKANEHTTVIHVETDPLIYAPDSQSWWDALRPDVPCAVGAADPADPDHQRRRRPCRAPEPGQDAGLQRTGTSSTVSSTVRRYFPWIENPDAVRAAFASLAARLG